MAHQHKTSEEDKQAQYWVKIVLIQRFLVYFVVASLGLSIATKKFEFTMASGIGLILGALADLFQHIWTYFKWGALRDSMARPAKWISPRQNPIILIKIGIVFMVLFAVGSYLVLSAVRQI